MVCEMNGVHFALGAVGQGDLPVALLNTFGEKGMVSWRLSSVMSHGVGITLFCCSFSRVKSNTSGRTDWKYLTVSIERLVRRH